MECPNCEALINDMNQNFCESCGFELNRKRETNKKPVNKENRYLNTRRSCCG